MSTYSTNLKIELIGTGEQVGTWGNTTNLNFSDVFETAIVGRVTVNFATDANRTLSATDSVAAQDFRNVYLNLTSGVSLTTTRELIVPTINKNYVIQNNTTGGQSITVKTSAGTGITVPNGTTVPVYVDGTNVIQAFDYIPSLNIGTLDLTNIEVTNIKAKDGTASASIANSTGVMTINSSVLTTTDINGGTIDGTAIGSASASTGAFTTLAASGTTTLSGNAIISVTDNTNAALRITQLGTGNALLVEDSANPDASPFVIANNGNVIAGNTTAFAASTLTPGINFQGLGGSSNSPQSIGLNAFSADVNGPVIYFGKSRGSVGTAGLVSNNDFLGALFFEGSDGASQIRGASISAVVDGTPGTNDMPGRLVFSTTADGASSPTERMRIDSAGNIGVGGTASAFEKVSVSGTLPTGSANTRVVVAKGTIPSGTTSLFNGFRAELSTAASSFTLTNAAHFFATQGTIGAGSAVTNQYGYFAESTLTGATNNFGFYSNIASGSGRYNFYANGTADNYFAGSVGVGTTSLTDAVVKLGKNITGGSGFSNGLINVGNIQSDVTTRADIYSSFPATQATAFTLANLNHFYASGLTIGSGSAVTNQFGFHATSGLTGATNNFGFYSNIASGSGRYNFYANGTADNYFAGNVLVGTTTAQRRLTVSAGDATGNGVGIVNTNTAANTTKFSTVDYFGTDTIGTVKLSGYVRALPEDSNYVASAMTFATRSGDATAERMRIDSSGNVGIGTTSPSAKLNVSVSDASGTGARLDVSNPESGSLLSLLATGTTFSQAGWPTVTDAGILRSGASATGGLVLTSGAASSPIIFSPDSTERMRITSDGLVLIGDSTSRSSLGYAQGVQLSRVSGTLGQFRWSTDNGAPELVSSKARGSSASPIIVANNDGLWLGRFAGYDGTNYVEAARISVEVDGIPGTNDMPGRLVFFTTADGASSTTERMRIDSRGNLGLNITPSAWGSGIRSIQVGNYSALTNNQAGFTWLSNNAFFDTAWKYLTTNRALYYAQDTGDGGHKWFNAPTGTAGNAITFTQAMTLDASGNFMLGTTTPIGKFRLSNGSGQNFVVDVGTNVISLQNYGSTGSGGVQQLDLFGSPITFTTGAAGGTSGAERMRLDSSGNLGLGVTPSAWSSSNLGFDIGSTGALWARKSGAGSDVYLQSNGYWNGTNHIYKTTSNGAGLYAQTGGQHLFYTAPSGTAGNAITFTQAMTLDASGNLVVGGTTANLYGVSKAITLNAASGQSCVYEYTVNGVSTGYFGGGPTATWVGSKANIPLVLYTNDTERMRIDSSGNLLVGASATVNGAKFLVTQGTTGSWNTMLRSTGTGGTTAGLLISYANHDPNNTSNQFWYCEGNGTTLRAELRSNGGIANYSGNNVNLSDAREKTNVELAGNYLDKICAIPVKTFNYIDQNLEEDDGLTLGVIAQDVQAVAPELVMESNWGSKEEPKMRLSIYQTDLQYALMKCIQEQQAIINDLKARIETIENKE